LPRSLDPLFDHERELWLRRPGRAHKLKSLQHFIEIDGDHGVLAVDLMLREATRSTRTKTARDGSVFSARLDLLVIMPAFDVAPHVNFRDELVTHGYGKRLEPELNKAALFVELLSCVIAVCHG
jgi:hypothetical protein